MIFIILIKFISFNKGSLSPFFMDKKGLNVIQVAAGLISLHYGLGFLFGTSEAVYQNGISGITYALMCSLGLVLLSRLVPFYHKNKLPIWSLFKNKYDKRAENYTVFLSWFWMIGVVASQVISSAYILNLMKIPIIISLLIVITIVSLVSLMCLEKLSKILLYLLIINSSILLYCIFSLPNIGINQIIPQLSSIQFSMSNYISFFSIAIPTVLITLLGMDFHQFIVRGKNIFISTKATISAGVALSLLSFIPSVLAIKVKFSNIIPNNIDGKQLIPYTMIYLSEKFFGTNLKYLFLVILIATTVGSCSCLIRIMVQTFQKFEFIPKKIRKNREVILLLNGIIIFLLTIKNSTLISLIVSFYIIYIVGVLIPFITLLFNKKNNIFKSSSIFWSMIAGTLVSLIFLFSSKLNLINIQPPLNLEFVMLISGIMASLFTLISDKIVQLIFFKNNSYVKRNYC